jgi:hypothetical protein
MVVMKTGRLRWAEHVIKMGDREMWNRITNYKQKVRRLKVRWIVVVNNDMRRMGVKKWGIEGRDRDGWQRILEEPKAHLGL